MLIVFISSPKSYEIEKRCNIESWWQKIFLFQFEKNCWMTCKTMRKYASARLGFEDIIQKVLMLHDCLYFLCFNIVLDMLWFFQWNIYLFCFFPKYWSNYILLSVDDKWLSLCFSFKVLCYLPSRLHTNKAISSHCNIHVNRSLL